MEVLKAYLDKKKTKTHEAPKALDEKTVFFLFQKIVKIQYGKLGLVRIEPVYFREGVLGIRTKNPLWANELWLERGGLCEKLNAEIGEELVKDLKLFH